jgi:hypothetical protein
MPSNATPAVLEATRTPAIADNSRNCGKGGSIGCSGVSAAAAPGKAVSQSVMIATFQQEKSSLNLTGIKVFWNHFREASYAHSLLQSRAYVGHDGANYRLRLLTATAGARARR